MEISADFLLSQRMDIEIGGLLTIDQGGGGRV